MCRSTAGCESRTQQRTCRRSPACTCLTAVLSQTHAVSAASSADLDTESKHVCEVTTGAMFSLSVGW